MDIHPIRIPFRTARFVGLTFAFLAGFEVERAIVQTERERHDVTFRWMQRYGKGLNAIYGVDVTARGPHVGTPWGRYPARDARGVGRVFVMNHRSMFDIFVSLAFFEGHIVSRADLARWPVIGLAARRVNTLFVDRASKQSGSAVVGVMCDAVREGRGVTVYPEGTTFADDEVRPFRSGAFLVAQRTGAEIVPVGIAYEGQGTAFHGAEGFVSHLLRVSSTKRTRVGLAVGEPICEDHADLEATKALARARVQALVHEARALLGKAGEFR